ncbi:MAG: DUF6064 family protein [Geminicoccaceae bacterium]
MSEWWTYRLEDFLLFSPRTYWRMFELHNEALWPLQIPALLLGATILVWVVRTPPWSGRVVSISLAAAWIWVAWAFLWNRYATINWAASYAVPAFAVQALLLAWFGVLRGHLHFTASWTGHGVVGLTLLLYAIILHPLVAILAGRSIQAAEVFGIAPDPTAIATLGLVSIVAGGSAALLLLVVPLAWCVVSWATLHTMGSPEGWLPLAAAVLTAASRIMSRPGSVERRDPGDKCH